MLPAEVVIVTGRKILGATLAGSMMLFVSAPAVARAGDARTRIRNYEGTTSDGKAFSVTTAKVGSHVELRGLDLEGTLTCDDGTQFGFGSGFGFGPGYTLPPTRLDFDRVDLSEAIHIHGRLGAHVGSGTISLTMAALTTDEQAQLCTTGELTWQLQRSKSTSQGLVPAGTRTFTLMGSGGVTGTVRTSAAGTTAETFVMPGTATAAETSRPRHYAGRDSQDQSMSVTTAKVGSTIQLRRIGFGWTHSCGDGSQFGFAEIFIFGGPMPLDPGRLDLDEIDLLFQALHVHGRLGVHSGSGTTSDTIPALTADEQAQLCTSGDLTWRAWRTDPGASID